MNFHSEQLNELCRFCANCLSGGRGRKTSYLVAEHTAALQQCFKLNARSDFAGVHPTRFCGSCKAFVTRSLKQSTISTTCDQIVSPSSSSRCAVWEPHKRNNCTVCQTISDASKPGRKKEKKERLVAPALLSLAKASAVMMFHVVLKMKCSAVMIWVLTSLLKLLPCPIKRNAPYHRTGFWLHSLP